MKKLLAAFVFSWLTISAFAQYNLSVTYQYGFSGKDLYSSSMKNSLAGLNAKIGYNYDDYLSFNLGTGYYLIPFENIAVDGLQTPVTGATLSVIPVTIGAEFMFLDQRADVKQKVKPYLGIDVGYAYTIQSESSLAPKQTQNNVLIAPSFGINYNLNNTLTFTANVRGNYLLYTYRNVDEYIEVFSLIGVNAGIRYSF